MARETARPPLRVALVADMVEERWPSMDLVADVLARELGGDPSLGVSASLVRPSLLGLDRWRRAEGAPTVARVVNRFWLYRRALPSPGEVDVFHIVDHSYGHLALSLPPDRTVVTCHDVDAFEQHASNGQAAGLPDFLVRRLARGLARAARVVCPSRATAAALVERGLVHASRVSVVHNGVDLPALTASEVSALSLPLLGPPGAHLDVLHVGSTIPRKRIDLLLRVFARAAVGRPTLRLVRVGGALNPSQQALAESLGIASRIVDLPPLDRRCLAAIYRRALLLLCTSEREGFGLPVAEALAASTPVVASDIPVLREIGGDAIDIAPVDQLDAWVALVSDRLAEALGNPAAWSARKARAQARGNLYSWHRYAAQMADVYWSLVPAAVSRRSVLA